MEPKALTIAKLVLILGLAIDSFVVCDESVWSNSSSSSAVQYSVAKLGTTWLSGRVYGGNDQNYDSYSHVTIWIGDHELFNVWWEGAMTKMCAAKKKIPVYYAYIAAFAARNLAGLQDCDVSSGPNLCNQGAQFIRNNRAYIVNKYNQFASNIAGLIGRNAVTVWLIEPDFYQYYSDSKQAGGTLTGQYMRALFDDFAKVIRNHLPNAIISWDISPWAGTKMTTWWGFFKTSPYISLTHTSGGRASATTDEIRDKQLKYSQVKAITGLPILADCGYGTGGGSLNNCAPWGVKGNIDARIANGVIGVSQALVVFVPNYRPQVKK